MILAKVLGLLSMLIILLSKPTVSSPTALPIAKPGCNDQCGEVKIPYPFGMTEGCYLDKRFWITCNNSYNPPEPFLGDSMINVTELSLQGQLHILKLISRKCYDQLGKPTEEISSIFEIFGFTINSTVNKLVAVGCDTAGYAKGIRNNGHNDQMQTVGPVGCISLCEDKDSVINGSCSGGGCCQTSIPSMISELELRAESFNFHKNVYDFNPCSYAFIVEEGKFNFSFQSLINLQNTNKLPVVLDWAIGDENDTCETAKLNSSSFACQNNTNCLNDQDDYIGYRCSCTEGYQGNPYLPNIGCQDIDECQNEETNNCTFKELCKNVEGDYKCSCPKGYLINGDGKGSEGCMLKSTRSHQLLVARILAGIAVGTAVALVGCSWYYFRYRRKRLISMMREGLYHGNEGTGTTGEQHLTELNGSSNNTNFSGTQSDEKPTNRLMRNA